MTTRKPKIKIGDLGFLVVIHRMKVKIGDNNDDRLPADNRN